MRIKKIIQKQPFLGKNAIICGGSKGIGAETSQLLVELGANVCIIARNQKNLEKFAAELESSSSLKNQVIKIISCDCTDMEKLKPLLENHIQQHGIPDYLINMVGYAYPQYIERVTLEDCKKNMNVNYYGQLIPILVLIPYFMKQRHGHIINVSSVLGFMGIMGYTTYTPSKHAIVGLSEGLRNEVKPYNIDISVLYPPDTQTPGFDEENLTKPPECAIISQGGKILPARKVAESLVIGILKKKFNIFPGEAKLINILKRIAPKIVFSIIDADYKKARKKLGKEI